MTTWGWGGNTNGSLGVGSTGTKTTPQTVSGVDSLKNASGLGTTIFLTLTGDVYLAGSTANGIRLNGTNPGNVLTPTQETDLSNIVKVGSCGGFDAFALDNAGVLWGWGANTDGELGLGDTVARTSPVQLLTNVKDFTAGVPDSGSGGHGWVLALLNSGVLRGTGFNGGGQLALGNTTSHTSWTTITPPSGTIVALQTGTSDENFGYGYSLLTMADGSSYGAGSTPDGQLGISSGSFQTSWLSLPFVNSKLVYGSLYATFSIKTDGTLWAIGYNGFALLGNTGVALNGHTNTPVQVQLPAGVTVADAGLEGEQFAAKVIGSDGNVYVWGANSSGEGGNGTTTPTNLTTPTAVGSFPGAPLWIGGSGTNVFAGTLTPPPVAQARSWVAVIG